MTQALPSWPMLSAFLVASVVLAITPGPGVCYIVARSLAHGRRAGLASVAAVAVGNLGNAVAAALGLAALFAVSSLAFMVVTYAGAAYLVWLGIKALRAAPVDASDAAAMPAPVPLLDVFRDGLAVALLNPKTAIFFAAFLPQFLTAGAAPMQQSIVLGAMFVAIAAVTDCAYALAAGIVAPAIAGVRGMRTIGRRLTGLAFIGLGVFSAIAGARTAR